MDFFDEIIADCISTIEEIYKEEEKEKQFKKIENGYEFHNGYRIFLKDWIKKLEMFGSIVSFSTRNGKAKYYWFSYKNYFLMYDFDTTELLWKGKVDERSFHKIEPIITNEMKKFESEVDKLLMTIPSIRIRRLLKA